MKNRGQDTYFENEISILSPDFEIRKRMTSPEGAARARVDALTAESRERRVERERRRAERKAEREERARKRDDEEGDAPLAMAA